MFTIEGSGLGNDLYGFALKAHFDFLVTDAGPDPLFAVEFDGPQHADPEQRLRDERKNDLCEHFGLPLLRINSKYLVNRRREMDLLGWFIHAWFCQRDVNDAWEAGEIQPDNPVNPTDVISLPGETSMMPLHLDAEARAEIAASSTVYPGQDFAPSCIVAEDADGNLRALAWLRLEAGNAIFVTTGMRAQRFPVPVEEALEGLAVLDLHQLLKRMRDGKASPVSLAELSQVVRTLRARSKHWLSCSYLGELPG